MRLIRSLAPASVLIGCAERSPRVSTQAAALRPDFAYIDLQTGLAAADHNTDTPIRKIQPRDGRLPHGARFVRLIFLVADHDMAVAAARDTDSLELLTTRLLAGPAEACRTEGRSLCSWIPQGIAIVPEVRKTVDGVQPWVPVR